MIPALKTRMTLPVMIQALPPSPTRPTTDKLRKILRITDNMVIGLAAAIHRIPDNTDMGLAATIHRIPDNTDMGLPLIIPRIMVIMIISRTVNILI